MVTEAHARDRKALHQLELRSISSATLSNLRVCHQFMMKPSTSLPILTLSILVTVTLAAPDAQNQATCLQRFPATEATIQIFCSGSGSANAVGKHFVDGITVPSRYADTGIEFTASTGDPLWLRVSGDCSPPRWLPKLWCLAQFWKLCASTSDAGGWNSRLFGTSDCQNFTIGPRE